MGGSAWSSEHYASRSTERAKRGSDGFDYDRATSSKPAADRKAHVSLDPHGVKVRESRDSEAHPESLAIAVLIDVTGSMREVPRIIQKKLPALMGLLIRKGYVAHPQILVGAIGDATCDSVPLQLGQFESGIEIDDNITNLFLEGGGGGSLEESYDLGLYFLARHTSIDCMEKRSKRGYAFVIGDEKCRDKVRRGELSKVLGVTAEADVDIVTIVGEVESKFDTYFILPRMSSHYDSPEVHDSWVRLFGQNVLRLPDPEGISELIATTIGLAEGKTDIDRVHDDLKAAGTGIATANAVRDALIPIGAGKGSDLSVPDSGAGTGLTEV